MSPLIESLLREADSQAAGLQHTIVWGAFKQRTAHGSCLACGRKVTISTAEEGSGAGDGRALQEACTRDYIMKKPSLQRMPAPPPQAPSLRERWRDSAANLFSAIAFGRSHEPANSDSS